MQVTSTGIVDGVIDDAYGKRGVCNEYGIPTYSLPLSIVDAPEETVSFALFMEDKDAFLVTKGFSWVHWVAANIVQTELPANASQENPSFVQGPNSWMSEHGGSVPPELCSCYGGMAPPDAPHTYELHVFALDCMLDLQNGFGMNEMFAQMRGHVLDTAVLYGRYDHEKASA